MYISMKLLHNLTFHCFMIKKVALPVRLLPTHYSRHHQKFSMVNNLFLLWNSENSIDWITTYQINFFKDIWNYLKIQDVKKKKNHYLKKINLLISRFVHLYHVPAVNIELLIKVSNVFFWRNRIEKMFTWKPINQLIMFFHMKT